MEFLPGYISLSVDQREKKRREQERGDEVRRIVKKRRYDTLQRGIISVLEKLGLTRTAAVAKSLAERDLLGPVFMLMTAGVTLCSYSLTMGWEFATELIIALLIHEFGHFLAAKRLRYKTELWWFYPFLGAIWRLPQMRGRHDEAYIAFGGPLLGGGSAAIAFALWQNFPESGWSTTYYHFALVATWVNLFNLICIAPLDGGRIMQAVHKWIPQVFGFGMLVFVTWFYKQPVFFLVWIVVVIEQFLEHPLWCFVIAVVLLVMMAFFMFSGFRSGVHLEDWIYLASGAVLILMSRLGQQHREEERDEVSEENLSTIERVLWGVSWFALFAFLFWLFLFLAENKPQ